MTLFEKLLSIQQQMKAPKSKKNTFGNYYYRSAEDILEAFKPYSDKHKVVLIISDAVELIGNRHYIKATATLHDVETCEEIETTAYARESESKKGMDESQITGVASSYARKYALNALFLLDDTKDADTDEHKAECNERARENCDQGGRISTKEIKELRDYFLQEGLEERKVLEKYKVRSIQELTPGKKEAILNPSYLAYFKQECSRGK